jgi:hypothetical protein
MISIAILAPALAGDTLIGIVQAAQESHGIDRGLAQAEALGLDAGGGVEIVDRRKQPARLLDDLDRAGAVAGAGRPHILAVDHLREADDRVQRRAQLVHQLAQRIRRQRRSKHSLRRAGSVAARDFVHPRPAGAATVAEEGPGARVEERHARDAPIARGEADPGHRETGIAERRALLERACRLAVHAVLSRAGDTGDGLAHQRSARRIVHPVDHSVGAGFPAEAADLRSRFGFRRAGGRLRLGFPESFDPRDELAYLRFAAFGCGPGLLARGLAGAASPTDPDMPMSLAPKRASACATSGARSRRFRTSEREVCVSVGKSATHCSAVIRAPLISGAATAGLSSEKKRNRIGEMVRPPRDRAISWRVVTLISGRCSWSQSRAISTSSLTSGSLCWASRSTSCRHLAARAEGCPAGNPITVAILSSKRTFDPLPPPAAGKCSRVNR